MDNAKPLVSIIVPVYNAEEQLDVCIKSLVAQTYPNIEIILVNDGSTDNSEAICRKYASENSNITLINKSNGGVSSARNCGIRASKGKFLYFCDSDDALHDRTIELMVKEHNGEDDTILYTDMQLFTDELPETEITDYQVSFRKQKNASRYAIWAILVPSKPILENGVFFDERISNLEDALWYRLLLLYIDKIYVLPLKLYYHRLRSGSLTAGNTIQRQVGSWYTSQALFTDSVNKLTLSKHQIKTVKRSYTYYQRNLFSEIYHGKVTYRQYLDLISDSATPNKIRSNYLPLSQRLLRLFGNRVYFTAYRSVFKFINIIKKLK